MLTKQVAPELHNFAAGSFSPAIVAHVQAAIEKAQADNNIVIHTAFVGGGRVNGISDASSDFDIYRYAFFLPANPSACQLRRLLHTSDAVDKTILIKSDSAVDEAGVKVDIEYRFWDVEKLIEMLWAENGDAIDWMRPPSVLCSRGTFYKGLFDRTAAIHESRFGNYAALCVARKYFGRLNSGLNSATQEALQALGLPKGVKAKDAATLGPEPAVLYAIPTLSVKEWMNIAHAALIVEYQLQNYNTVAPINFEQLLTEVKLTGDVAAFLRELRAKRSDAVTKREPVAIGGDIYTWMNGVRQACIGKFRELEHVEDVDATGETRRKTALFNAIETALICAQKECGLAASYPSGTLGGLIPVAPICKAVI
jgi:predicted nucleotidyltransferase